MTVKEYVDKLKAGTPVKVITDKYLLLEYTEEKKVFLEDYSPEDDLFIAYVESRDIEDIIVNGEDKTIYLKIKGE